MTALRALIAEDEVLLRNALVKDLHEHMPELEVVAQMGDGISALEWLRSHSVDIVFLDIQMPGLTGLEVAQSLLDSRSKPATPVRRAPLVVFVTAFDEYALEAFNAEAVDYLLKPVTVVRLQQALERIRRRLAQRESLQHRQALEAKLKRALAQASEQTGGDDSIRSIRVSIGGQIRLIPIKEVILFQADDKYVSVYTRTQQSLIREPLRTLLPRLPQNQFVQIHRSSIVNLKFVEAADRTVTGKMTLIVRGLSFQPPVSRSLRYLFKAM